MMIKRLTALIAACVAALCMAGTPALAAQDTPAAGIVATVSSGLNVRSSASASAPVLTSLPKGSAVTLISQSGSWWKVRYGANSYGYSSAAYIKTVDGSYSAVVSTASGRLNVRSGPGSSYSVLVSLPKGTAVAVLSQANGWSRILYNGVKTGYVSSAYLSASGGSAAFVSLAVPSYKQTDSRWASVQIGSSGKTIGQIGCTTTALAMTESYRLGTSVNPAEMSRRLSYSSGGALYWPSNYRLVSESSGALSTVLSLLRQGAPVIYGAKTSSGQQHWVVVTGYNGLGLSAENFTILDPGSASRTTLRQFLNAYPVFHRLAYAG